MHNGSVIASNIFNESSTQTEGFVVKLILPLENKIEALKVEFLWFGRNSFF